MKCVMIALAICMAVIAAVNATPLGHQIDKRQRVLGCPTALDIDGMKFDGITTNDDTVQLEALENATFIRVNVTLIGNDDQTASVSTSNATDANGTASADYFLPDYSPKRIRLPRDKTVTIDIPISRVSSRQTRSVRYHYDRIEITRIYFTTWFQFPCGRTIMIRCCVVFIRIKLVIWGDPHFTVPLLNGENLCYSVQGIPGLPFNLLSNRHLIINALFISSINDPTQATWIGKLAVISQRTNKPQIIVFDSVSQSVKIEGRGIFKPQFLQYIAINETNNIVFKATRGLMKQKGNPTVEVFLNNPSAVFYVTFHKDHLDIDWKIQNDKVDGSHGLLGQFMVKDVKIDSTKQILTRPGFEPVPVKLSKNWNSPDKCWLAKNVGNQGEGLIKGSIYDYIVDTIESTNVPSFEI